MKFNKIKLIAGLCLAFGVSALGQNNVGTLVTDPVRPFSVSSTHPSAIANEIKGGPFTSSNLAGLSNIPAPRLEIGAIGYATNTGLYYRLTATNPATWSSIDGINITNLNASNITGSIPFLNISNALTNANVAFGTATFNNAVQGPVGVATNPAFRFGTNQSGFYYGSQLGFGQSVAVSIFGSNIARFQSNRVVFDQPIDFLSSTSSAALTTRTNLGIQDFVTNPVVQVVSGGTGATNAGGARTNLGLGATNNVAFGSVAIGAGDLQFLNDSIFWAGSLRYSPEDQSFEGSIGINNGSIQFVGTNATANIATTRTNLGLGATWLTNTNVTNFRTAIGLGTNAQPVFDGALITGDLFAGSLEVASGSNSTAITADGIEFTGNHAAKTRTNLSLGATWLTNTNNPVFVNTNGSVVSPTNFWDVAPIQTTVQNFLPAVNATNAATNARTLYVYSMAISTTGVTHVITLPTNAATKNGDEATVIHMGPASSVTAVRQLGQTNNLITINKTDESVKFIYENNAWTNFHNISFVEPIQFSGTNASANAAATRTNLGLGATNDVIFGKININSFSITNNPEINFNSFFGVGYNLRGLYDYTGNYTLEINGPYQNIFTIKDLGQPNGGTITLGTNSALVFNGNGAAQTRTNLGIGVTDIVTFAGITNNGDIRINQTTATNGLLFVYRTNNEPFLGLANLIASNNTTVSNETLFRVGAAEATNKSAQFGFRSTNTNGNGVAVFSVFGYNALMMIGPSDPAAGTNPIQATIYSINPTNRVMTLITTNTGAMQMHRPIEWDNTTNSAVTRTNLGLGLAALTNTNNAGFQRAVFQTNTTPAAGANLGDAKAWLEISVVTNNVTNSFRIPVFQ